MVLELKVKQLQIIFTPKLTFLKVVVHSLYRLVILFIAEQGNIFFQINAKESILGLTYCYYYYYKKKSTTKMLENLLTHENKSKQKQIKNLNIMKNDKLFL